MYPFPEMPAPDAAPQHVHLTGAAARRWYQHWWIWAIAAVLLPLVDWVAIPLMFRYAPWRARTKWLVAIALVAWAVVGIAARSSGS